MSADLRQLFGVLGEHLLLVIISTGIALLIGVPAGIALTRRPRWQRPVLGLANVLQTVPSLALFGLLIPLPLIGGIGARTAIVALVLYALLPLVRNTVTGIEGVDRGVRESAVAMGMTDWQVLWQVELPLAVSVILAGVRVATVISVGVATIAAAVGAGGLGTYIFRGLRMNDNRLILMGAVPAAVLALGLDQLIGVVEARVRPGRRRAGGGLAMRMAGAVGLFAVVAAGLWALGARAAVHDGQGVRGLVIGSKDYTEQVILGELLALSLEARGVRVERRFELGGNLCHDALLSGQIDCYPEYTGTALMAILHEPPRADAGAVYERVRGEYARRFSLQVGPPLGFRNDFAILVRGKDARALGLRRISDVAPLAPRWRAGFGQDFISRPDGYTGFARTYGLTFAGPPREMDLSLTYRALGAGEVDLIAGNSTDGLIDTLGLVQLEDDRGYFPPYEAVYVCRQDALRAVPAAREALVGLGGTLGTEAMRRLNRQVDGDKLTPSEAARRWLEQRHR